MLRLSNNTFPCLSIISTIPPSSRDLCDWCTTVSADESGDETDYKEHQENVEKNLRNTGSGIGDSAKSENGGDDRNNEEYKSPVKHKASYRLVVKSAPIDFGVHPANLNGL